ncbi:hypothetical protein [uncultured Acinetobacter sp.]|uniref:hypothetical protein n=1 Tax=uncultured Acinetobacter sp. TaxID=165433 RepID=UPI002613BE97|nr:hypothetical protein [uncultured Acinetobacter sp.]
MQAVYQTDIYQLTSCYLQVPFGLRHNPQLLIFTFTLVQALFSYGCSVPTCCAAIMPAQLSVDIDLSGKCAAH